MSDEPAKMAMVINPF